MDFAWKPSVDTVLQYSMQTTQSSSFPSVWRNKKMVFRGYLLKIWLQVKHEGKRRWNQNIHKQEQVSQVHTWYLSFFLHEPNFWRIKFTPKKRVNYGKIHSNCQFFALIWKNLHRPKKNLHEYIREVRDKYQVWSNHWPFPVEI